jgi:hypothetical protein
LQRSLERQEENRLLTYAAQLARLKTELQGWNENRLERKQQALEELQRGSPAAMLHLLMKWEESARSHEAQLREQIRIAEEARLQQMQAYRQARQKREVLDGLKEQLETTYDLDETRHTQQRVDEAFLLRSFYWKNS